MLNNLYAWLLPITFVRIDYLPRWKQRGRLGTEWSVIWMWAQDMLAAYYTHPRWRRWLIRLAMGLYMSEEMRGIEWGIREEGFGIHPPYEPGLVYHPAPKTLYG